MALVINVLNYFTLILLTKKVLSELFKPNLYYRRILIGS